MNHCEVCGINNVPVKQIQDIVMCHRCIGVLVDAGELDYRDFIIND